MRQILISALKRIVQADFKTVRKKFLTTTPEKVVDDYLAKYKTLRDTHRISNTEERNIDYWGMRSFDAFKYFMDTLTEGKSKRQQKKFIHKEVQNVPGAALVAQNESWLVYRIDTYAANELLGSRNWCTVRNKHDWDKYTENADFYYFLSLNKDKDDRWFKIAMSVDKGGRILYWDNFDRMYRSAAMPDLNKPKFIITQSN